MSRDRRELLKAAALGLAAGATPPALAADAAADLPALWDVDRSLVNLDAAYYGAMPAPVRDAYLRRVEWLNRRNSAFLRDALPGFSREGALDQSRDAVAALLGARRDEIALGGGGTEALYALIANYARLAPGDQVILADADYDEMQHAMAFLRARRGVEIHRIALPEPPGASAVIAAYDAALNAAPRARLMLLTHVSNRHGYIPPVKTLIDRARARGVDVIVDSAQAVGQVPFTVDEIGADFVGFSLHKWLAAPLGTGGIYIRRSRLDAIEPWLGNHIYGDDDIRARLPTGTQDFAAQLTVPEAAALHQKIGPGRKLARLRALRRRWIDALTGVRGVEIIDSADPSEFAATGALRLTAARDLAGTRHVQAQLLQRFGVLVVAKPGLAGGPVLRVTPAVFTTEAEIDRFADAVKTLAREI